MNATRGDVLGIMRAVRSAGSDSAMVLCPFHRKRDGGREKCPSLRINFATRAFFCFACREEGVKCGRESTRTQRRGGVADTVLVGGAETYEPRCLSCFDPKGGA